MTIFKWNVIKYHSDSETIHGLALSLESINDILWSNCLSLSMISIDEWITNDDIEECLQDLTSLWIDGWADSLDTTSTSKTSDSWLSDTSENVFIFRSMLSLTKAGHLTFTLSWHCSNKKGVENSLLVCASYQFS